MISFTPQHVFIDCELTDLSPSGDLISLALVSGNKRLYIEITDSWSPEDCSDFVLERVLPLLGRHDPERHRLERGELADPPIGADHQRRRVPAIDRFDDPAPRIDHAHCRHR